ncbi:MAG: TetR-like C-terminal domain-containing protein, partial [Actinomycetota bacterium]
QRVGGVVDALDGLAVAIEAFQHLEAFTREAIEGIDDPADALAALGRAYVTVAVEHPGHCAIVFRGDVVDADDPGYREWGERAHDVLTGAIERLADRHNPDLDIEVAAALCWSTMQGLVGLYEPMRRMAEHDGAELPPIGDLAEQFSRIVTVGFVSR